MEDKRHALMEVKDLQKSLGIKGFIGTWIACLGYRILELKEVNRIYDKVRSYSGSEFSAHALEECKISFDVPAHQLEYIPGEGGFITVSNHHFGGADGMFLNSVVGGRRPDYKILTTFLLSLIPNLRESFLAVDNFSTGGAKSLSGIRAALGHIAKGQPLGLFPAGEVATWQRAKRRTALGKKRVVEDIPWADNIIKLIKRSSLPVIPIYFDGENSRSFHILGRIHPRLRTIRLVHELFKKRGQTIKVRIGQPIQPSEFESLDIEHLGRYLRSRCYALQAQCLQAPAATTHEWPVDVAPDVPKEQIIAEIDRLSDRMLFSTGDYLVYLLRCSEAPAITKELWRLREETFRAIGEGTGLAEDTDAYDSYYRQMIIWHSANKDIVGAYRLGFGPEIMEKHGGIDGFYTASLFRYGPKASELLSKSMELGRSFIAAKYQREVLPLRLLFTGLAVSTLECPQLQYFSGPVSISNDIPHFYKSLIYYYITKHYPIENARMVARPTHPFVPDYLCVNPDDLMQLADGNIDSLDRLLSALSDGKVRMPVLVRKYFSCGAKLPCFNVDPDFSFSLDGLIFLRYADFPQNTTRSFIRALPEQLQKRVWEQFYGTNPQ